MKTKSWPALTLVFVSGCVIGFIAGGLYLHWQVESMRNQGPEALRRYMTSRLNHYLHPTTQQQDQIQVTLKQLTTDLDGFMETHRQTCDQRVEQALKQLQPILTPEQVTTLDQCTLEDLLPVAPSAPPTAD